MRWSIQPYLGRFFHDADEHGPNSAPYLVLTYAYWHSHFQDDRGVVGACRSGQQASVHDPGRRAARVQRDVAFLLPDFWVPMVQQEQMEG